MADELFRITLKIAGREYPLTIHRQNEEEYRLASKQVNELVTMYNKRYSADMVNYLAMAALQLALENVRLSGQGGNTELIEELKRLEAEISNR